MLFWPELRGVLQHYSESKSAAVDALDAVALYGAVKLRAPMNVLELGPGTSTAIIAAALPDGGRITGIEESEEWLSFHRKMFPPALESRALMLHSNVAVSEEFGKPATYFKTIPHAHYDFVHVDGPSHLGYGCDATCDILRILPNLAARCMIVFDGRQESARLARPHLEMAGFRMRWNPYSLNREFLRG